MFYGSSQLPVDERPPIPYCPELDDPSWRPVYGEIIFDCPHWSVFENVRPRTLRCACFHLRQARAHLHMLLRCLVPTASKVHCATLSTGWTGAHAVCPDYRLLTWRTSTTSTLAPLATRSSQRSGT